VTSASVHDSQKLDDLLDPDNTASPVRADSAYLPTFTPWLAPFKSEILAFPSGRHKDQG
jgi:hypothetical protein